MINAMIRRKFSSVSRRAVYDIGSGSIKFQVADVDLRTNKIVKNHIQKAQQVLFVNENKFTRGIQMEGLSKLKALQTLSNKYEVSESIGVATQAFRNSENGRECLDLFQEQLNFPLRIVSSNEEARLGFESAKAIVDVKEENLVVWDCGAGSYQMTSKDHEFSDTFGSGTVLKTAQSLATGTGSETAWTEHDFYELLRVMDQNMKPSPAWIYSLVNEWVAIGSAHSIFNQQRILMGNDVFTPACVEATIKDCLGLDYQELFELEKTKYALVQDRFEYPVMRENAKYMLPKLTLLFSVMTRADISTLQYVQTNGNCNALLTNTHLWEDQKGDGASRSDQQVSTACSKAKPTFLTELASRKRLQL
jgi:exopolyphosphatase/pppGpp-phosphohydrolase